MIREVLHTICCSSLHVLVLHNVGLQLLASGVPVPVYESLLVEIGERQLVAVLLGYQHVLLLQVLLHLLLGGLDELYLPFFLLLLLLLLLHLSLGPLPLGPRFHEIRTNAVLLCNESMESGAYC